MRSQCRFVGVGGHNLTLVVSVHQEGQRFHFQTGLNGENQANGRLPFGQPSLASVRMNISVGQECHGGGDQV